MSTFGLMLISAFIAFAAGYRAGQLNERDRHQGWMKEGQGDPNYTRDETTQQDKQDGTDS